MHFPYISKLRDGERRNRTENAQNIWETSQNVTNIEKYDERHDTIPACVSMSDAE